MSKNKNKHIVFIVENLSVPFDRRVWREANAMYNDGYRVSVISPMGKDQDLEKRIKLNGIEIYRYKLPLEQSSKFGYVLEYLKAFFVTLFLLIRISFSSRIHAIHIANPPDIFFPLGWLKWLFGYKFIFDQHDLSPETFLYKFGTEKNSLVYKLLLVCEKLTFRTADHIISTNQSLCEVAFKRGGKNPNTVTVVRNGPDKAFTPVDPINEIKKGKRFLAAYIGVMGTQDGVEYIIEAVKYLVHKQKKTNIYFILIGYGDEYQNHQELVKKYNLKDYIEMPGRLPDTDVIEILSTADVCLAPDPKNGLNEFHTMNKIMDYMRMGKPIVSFDLKESRLSAEIAAVYVPDNEPIPFANAIIRLLKDPEKGKKMSEFGISKVENELKWEYSVTKLLGVYNKLFSN